MNSEQERIFFFAPDDQGAIGGVKQIYRHVDVLREHGIEAWVLHRKKGFRCTWFANNTPTISWSEFQWKVTDIIVLPEIYGPRMAKRLVIEKHPTFINKSRAWIEELPAIRKVIFNQNAYNTFARSGFDPTDFDTPYLDLSVVGTIVVSEDSREYVGSVFPKQKIYHVHNAVNAALFSFEEKKKKQICFMPRKHRAEAQEVIGRAKFRGVLDGFTIIPIENIHEKDVATIMKESLIFLSFGYPEGFSLPPAEAMASGCIVIGYHGGGGKEFFLPTHSFPIANADILSFSLALEEVITSYSKDSTPLDSMRKQASQYILEHYSLQREEKDIIGIWKEILGHDIS